MGTAYDGWSRDWEIEHMYIGSFSKSLYPDKLIHKCIVGHCFIMQSSRPTEQ